MNNEVQFFNDLAACEAAIANQYIRPGTDLAITETWSDVKSYLNDIGSDGRINFRFGTATSTVNSTNSPGMQVPQRVWAELPGGRKLWVNEKHLTFGKNDKGDLIVTGFEDPTVGVATYVKARPETDTTGKQTGRYFTSFEDYVSGSSANVHSAGTLVI